MPLFTLPPFPRRQRGKKKEVKAALARLKELQDKRAAEVEAQQDAQLDDGVPAVGVYGNKGAAESDEEEEEEEEVGYGRRQYAVQAEEEEEEDVYIGGGSSRAVGAGA